MVKITDKLGICGVGIDTSIDKKMLYFESMSDGEHYIYAGLMPLSEFFDKLGITEKDCEKAFIDIAISKN